MNRRSLLIRSVMIPVSGLAFTATGWLMGTRTLTMPTQGTPPPEALTPPPGQQGVGTQFWNCGPQACQNGDEGLSCYCRFREACPTVYWDCWYKCSGQTCATGWCGWSSRTSPITC
jgi:hypothetical protein